MLGGRFSRSDTPRGPSTRLRACFTRLGLKPSSTSASCLGHAPSAVQRRRPAARTQGTADRISPHRRPRRTARAWACAERLTEHILAEQKLSELRRLRHDAFIQDGVGRIERDGSTADVCGQVFRSTLVEMPPADHRRLSAQRCGANGDVETRPGLMEATRGLEPCLERKPLAE